MILVVRERMRGLENELEVCIITALCAGGGSLLFFIISGSLSFCEVDIK
jgi:hypothetical protein